MSIKQPVAIILITISIVFFIIPKIKQHNFENLIEKISTRSDLKEATISLSAKYEGSENYLIQFNADKKIHPGSNFKLFTSTVSLEKLKPEFKIKTAIYLTPNNQLLLVGHGDPTFNQSDIPEIIEAIKQSNWQGGELLYHEGYFSGEQYGPNWDTSWLENTFAVPTTALQIDNNLIEIIGFNKEENNNFEIQSFSYKNYGKIVDQRKTVPSAKDLKDPITGTWDMLKEELTLQGDTIPNLPFTVTSTIKDPSLYTAKVFAQELEKANYKITTITETNEIIGELIHTHYSAPLSAIINEMLKFSRNNYAESLIRIIGEENSISKKDSQEKGVEKLREFIKKIPAITLEGFDGSGLSLQTRTTSNSIIALFDYINQQPYKEIIWSSLPQAKIDGTLKSRFENIKSDSQIYAKTGTHQETNSLSGKIVQNDGDKILFSIHITNHGLNAREATVTIIPIIDQIILLLDKQF